MEGRFTKSGGAWAADHSRVSSHRQSVSGKTNIPNNKKNKTGTQTWKKIAVIFKIIPATCRSRSGNPPSALCASTVRFSRRLSTPLSTDPVCRDPHSRRRAGSHKLSDTVARKGKLEKKGQTVQHKLGSLSLSHTQTLFWNSGQAVGTRPENITRRAGCQKVARITFVKYVNGLAKYYYFWDGTKTDILLRVELFPEDVLVV